MRPDHFYLSSLESTRFAPVRSCRIERTLSFDTGKRAVQVLRDPPVIGQDFNRGHDIERVLLTARHEDQSVSPVTEFPCFVHIAIPKAGLVEQLDDYVTSDGLDLIAWGELYRTRQHAERHFFG